MPRCYACEMHRKKIREYFGLSICNKCFGKFKLDSLEKTSIEDRFMKELIPEKDHPSVEALNAFASSFPRKFSKELLGICLANIDDEGMDGLAVSSFIIGARSVLLFGNDAGKNANPDSDKIHFLIGLANIVEISIIASHGREYEESGLDVEDDEILSDIGTETIMTTLDILNEIRYNDPRKELREEILEMFYALMSHEE